MGSTASNMKGRDTLFSAFVAGWQTMLADHSELNAGPHSSIPYFNYFPASPGVAPGQ
jgi:hypothetical protein